MAVVPFWLLPAAIILVAFVGVVCAFAYGNFKEKRACGKWPFIIPLIDIRFVLQGGDVQIRFIETHSDGRWYFQGDKGAIDVIENKGVLGWFGGKPYRIEKGVDDIVKVGNILYHGRVAFEQLTNQENVIPVRSEIEHWKLQAGKWQDVAEQKHHDPQRQIDIGLDQIDRLAKAAQYTVPKGSQSKGGKK